MNGVKHEYTLDGTKILRETWANSTLVPLYDNEDSVCGILYNDIPYYFIKNLQGDVIAIVNKDAETVARYSYDAWGVPTVKQDTSGCSIATINPFRYRSYYFDEEIGLYYLQSRYYDASVGRFVNGDIPEYALLSLNISTHNIIAYCLNNPIQFHDSFGTFIGEATAVHGLIQLCSMLLLLMLSWVSSSALKRSWNDFCAVTRNGLSWMATGIVNGGRATWSWTKKQVKAATAALTTFLTVARADSQIRTKVKYNSKQRYWAASILKISNYTYVSISSAISYSTAKSRVACGLCVFTVTRTEARRLASNFPPVVGPEIGLKDAGQYMHYHVKGRKNKSHIFFLF